MSNASDVGGLLPLDACNAAEAIWKKYERYLGAEHKGNQDEECCKLIMATIIGHHMNRRPAPATVERDATLEEACLAQCSFCREKYEPIQHSDGRWFHVGKAGSGEAFHVPCYASAIRALKSERGKG